MHTDLVRGIDVAYSEYTDLIVLALTGRTGSGCTTAALSISRSVDEMPVSEEDFPEPERRKMSIVLDYARSNWIPFTPITVSSVIFSFLLDEDLSAVDAFLEAKRISGEGREELSEHLNGLGKHLSCYTFKKVMRQESTAAEKATAWHFFETAVCPLALQTRRVLAGQYPPLFQAFGDNIRFGGTVLNDVIRPERLFSLMERVRKLIECVGAYRHSIGERKTRVVLDAVRNPLELVYLRKHVPSLFVVAITTENEDRRRRLMDGGLGKKEVDAIDEKEYDGKKHLTDYTSFVSQNLKDCIQKADIFVANPGRPGELASNVRFMNAQLVRYIVLALRPGLITPTRDERCMQVAFVAKLNSGCISRQVGAVVADADHSLCSLGWNDTPKGQMTCLLRDVSSIFSGTDSEYFSDFEKSDTKLRSVLEKRFKTRGYLKSAHGLRCPFCFKDAYNAATGRDNQVHTRSLHAEENAFLQLAKRGGAGIAGGVLFTTASPCELCSKKAFQLGIREIVYVDPYPGISTSHVLKSGASSTRPRLRLFSGAVGHAYHRLYEAMLPIKDEYAARLSGAKGFEESESEDLSDQQTMDLWAK